MEIRKGFCSFASRKVKIMLEIKNVKVYDLEESVIACRNAMRLDMPEYTEEEFEKSLPRAIQLANTPSGSGHQNFLKGIRVSFDIKYPNYISPELQRYNWIDIGINHHHQPIE